jgi:hypothetical protein
MTGPVLRAGAWPAVVGVTGAAVVAGGCGAAFPAAATVLFPVCFALLAAAAAFTLDEPSSDTVWWTVLAVCAVAIAISAGGRRLPRWRARGAIPRLPGAVRP